ncbi:MAG TPA: hypothetical protein VKS79_00915 [Gemmataceae bacterium]|nr:hypothetical protein [Gemmataceae bacterium]
MKRKHVFAGLWCVTVMGALSASAQAQTKPETLSMPRSDTPAPSAALVTTDWQPQQGPGPWVNLPAQTLPVGGNGPIGEEVFVATGPSLPVGGGVLVGNLYTGWFSEVGVRSLFFNPSRDAAWTVTLGIIDIWNDGLRGAGPGFTFFGLPVVARDYNRWFASGGLGRDWFLFRSPDNSSLISSFRIGAEVGGRWGTSHIDMIAPLNGSAYLRRQAVLESLYLATHADLEIPMGAAIFFLGFRAEYAFNWSNNITPGLDGNLQDLNLLVTAGFRY